MRRDQKLAKKKKARAEARTTARAGSGFSPAKAATKPFGPCWLSLSWRDDEMPPELVSAVITRDLGSLYVAHVMLVDRTCFGVKDAFTVGPMSRSELLQTVERVGQAHVEGMESVPVEVAQSVVFAALAYAERLGFRPSRDFDARLVGPAPSPLKATPLAARARPFYVPGPHDDVARTLSTLQRAVGEEGFDVGGAEDEDLEDERREDEIAIGEATATAYEALGADGAPPEGDVAMAQFLTALGVEDGGLPPEHRTSLPIFWAMLFRPLESGTRGVDLMRKRRPKDAAFAALAATRAVLFEVLSVVGDMGTCRDVLTGEVLRVRLGALATKATRWMRFFAYLTPMQDGSLYGPSTTLGHARLRDVAVDAWLAKVNELLASLAVDERIDPANPTPGLTRWGALAHAVLLGMLAASAKEDEQKDRPIFVVDSDGERFESHDATIPLAPAAEKALLAALAQADDFVAGDGGGFAWMREPRERGIVAGEHTGLVALPEGGALRVTTTSVARFEELRARLEVLAGAPLVPSRVDTLRPWEHMRGAVAVETAESRRVVLTSSRVPDGAVGAERLYVDHALRALDVDVPMLGGKPREVVKDEDGRRRVERWIQDQEARGIADGNAFLDLDPVRRELGLPGVFPLGGALFSGVPERKISETILEFAQPILDALGADSGLVKARQALHLAVQIWNVHAMATPPWGDPSYLAEARATMREPGTPPEMRALFEELLARRATLFGDDPRVVADWSLAPDGRGGHAFRCESRVSVPNSA